ncbi:hypothetical protein [Tsuneonella troitsensis]|nr:hypothetical protein [Tsuneonella troitsensis]
MNPIQAQIVLRHLRTEVKENRDFAETVSDNPIDTLVQFGFSKKAAAAMIAQEVGLGSKMGITDITTCCATNITSCCVSNKGIFDHAIRTKSLPDVNDSKAWKALLSGR